MSTAETVETPDSFYERRIGQLREQLGELRPGSLLAEDIDMLEEQGEQFSRGEISAESLANRAILVYWTHYQHVGGDAALNLTTLGLDFGREAGVPGDQLAMHWNSAYELKDFAYLRSDVKESRLIALGKVAFS